MSHNWFLASESDSLYVVFLSALKFPLAVLAAEIDPITSADLVAEYETALKENKEVSQIGIFVFSIFARYRGCWNTLMQ